MRARSVRGPALLTLSLVLFAAGPARGEGVFDFLKSDEQKARERAVEEIRKRARIVEEGTSGRDVRRAATAALPMQALTAPHRKRVDAVLADVGMYRRLPTIEVDVDPEVYQFFVHYPDVAVSVWRALDISKFEMTQTGPTTYDAAIGDGTEGDLEVLLRTRNEHLVFCKGLYKPGPLLKTVEANCLLHLRNRLVRTEAGGIAVRHELDMFVSFPSSTVETAAKLVSPVSNVIIDRNFHEVSLFLHMMTALSASRPAAVHDIAGRLEGVSEAKREALKRLSSRVHARTRQAMARPPVTPTAAVRPASGSRPR